MGEWINWKGGACPLKKVCTVRVVLANGEEYEATVDPLSGGGFWWSHQPGNQLNIVAYKIVDTDEGQLFLNQLVEKCTGDYRFPGIVKSVFKTEKGHTRYVVESTSPDTLGMLHIFSRANLKPREPDNG